MVALIAWSTFVTPALAQDQVALPGVVSRLTMDSENRIQCEIHAHDAVADEHNRTIDQNARMDAARKHYYKKKWKKKGATIIVDYLNLDPNFTEAQFEAAKASFQSAIDIWAKNVDSEVPIYVIALFQPLGEGVLGSAGSGFIYANVPGLQRDTWYGNALADKLVGEDVNPEVYDITARFSTVFPNWYFGTDGNTPDTDYDFRSVVLHELCHGLGFFGSMYVDNATGVGDWGFGIPDPVFPAIYDRYAYDRPGKLLIKKYPNFSTKLGKVLLDDPLLFRGRNTIIRTRGKGAKIFTVLDSDEVGDIPGLTDIWLPGSSYSHLDYLTYTGTKEGLMVPFLSQGVAFNAPGQIVKGMFDDMGWNGRVRDPFEEEDEPALRLDNLIVADAAEAPVSIYPNEVRNQFVLDLGSTEAGLRRAQLVDLLGRSYPLNFSKRDSRHLDFDLSTSPMQSGVYFLQLEFNNHTSKVLRLARVQ